MKQMEIKHRLALTLLYVVLVFTHILLTVLVVGLVLYLLIHFGVFSGPDNTQPTALQIILFFGIASLPAGMGISFVVSRVLLKPINTIISRINSLAAGDYSVRIHPASFWMRNSTVRELVDSFNRLAQELEGTEMLRSDFINNFSHEFKTPIVSIAGFAKLLHTGAATPEQEDEYLGIIESESMRLSQMATNVLNLTKIENQTVLTDVEEYNLSEQIRSCILLLEPKWEKKDIEFSLDFPEQKIRANRELMKQVWINLLDNAIKFSVQPGVIEVTISRTDQTVTVTVRNEGPDIPEEKQKKIFGKFYQADESHAAEGNGIGLAIVKRVVELHGGAVTASSQNGTTAFTTVLPLNKTDT